MTRKELTLAAEADTEAFGTRLAGLLPKGAFVALHGGLGAGKTALVRGIGRALGTEDVVSPTFTIVQEYDTEPKLCHFDAYRLADADELYEIGYEDYLAEDAIIVMEWAELVEEALPAERLEITMNGSGSEPRRVRIEAFGKAYEALTEEL